MGYDPKVMDRILAQQRAKVRGETLPPAADEKARPGRVILKGPGLNKTELLYAERLERLKVAGVIDRWRAKPFKLRLAHDKQYEPDFEATRADGRIVVIEIKGHLRDDARDKFKDAVQAWPEFDFLMIQKAKGGGWTVLMRSEGAKDL